MEADNEAVMYILINTDARMGKGKMVGQGGHAVGRVIQLIERSKTVPPAYQQWCYLGETKIVLKATKAQMDFFLEEYSDRTKDVWCVGIQDAGRTQVEPGTLTALAFCPIYRRQTPAILTSMKLV